MDEYPPPQPQATDASEVQPSLPHVNTITQHWVTPALEVSVKVTSRNALTADQCDKLGHLVERIQYLIDSARVRNKGSAT